MARRRGLTLDDLLTMDDLALDLTWKRMVEGGRGSFRCDTVHFIDTSVGELLAHIVDGGTSRFPRGRADTTLLPANPHPRRGV